VTGINDARNVLDSSFCINFLNKRLTELPEALLYISPVTRMEILAKPAYEYDKDAEQEAKDFTLVSCDKDLVPQLREAAPGLRAEYLKPLDRPAGA
jgi:predicted nucleic acid-binding protein